VLRVSAVRLLERLLIDDLEAVAAALGDDAEAGHADLGGLPAAVADLELGERPLDALGVELQDRLVADLDAGPLEQLHVGGLAAPALPGEVEAVVGPAGADAHRRPVRGEV